jgi:microcystin degradation protein MlrC
VINCSGYFRLHTDNAQIIVSARMLNELQKLNETRTEILKTYNSRLFDLIDNEELRTKMIVLTNKCKKQVAELASSIFRKYSEDTRFSSIRIFDVKFRGVHIEVEIPNKIEKV